MPLVLSLKQGEDFFVNDAKFVVTYVGADYATIAHRMAPKVSKNFTLTNKRAKEIVVGVMASEGVRKQPMTMRLVLEASLEKVILRGDVYRSKHLGVGHA